jgi:hypothetical protein
MRTRVHVTERRFLTARLSLGGQCAVSHNRQVSSALSAIPAAKRRLLAATLGLFAVLFLAVAAVAATGRDTAAAPMFAGVAIGVAALLALIAWGVVRSVRLDESNAQLEAAIEDTVRSYGGQLCDCGHEHDPGELHVTDACAHDGTGSACTHDCQTCLLRQYGSPYSSNQ